MKKKIIILVGIALCGMLLISPALAGASENALEIYGNANEDDTIDMRDLTYVKLIFFGKKPETELADAKYDGKINPLDFIQIKLIIVGKEKEMTIVDTTVTDTYPTGKVVTIRKPVKRVIAAANYDYPPEALRNVKAKDKIVGIKKMVADRKEFFPDLSKLPVIGKSSTHDIEKILSLNPDIVIASGSAYTKNSADLDQLESANIIVVRLDFYKPETMAEDYRKLGYILDKKAEAEEFIDWYEEHMSTINERVDRLSEDEKPRVYIESHPPMWYTTYLQGSGPHQTLTIAGGINIAANLPGGEWAKIDPEWVIEQNPDIIIKGMTPAGYLVDDPSKMKAERDALMDRPELANVAAVKKGQVYCLFMPGQKSRFFVGVAYLAKLFHPDLFTELDPEAINKEYLERFQGIPYRGIYAYPEPS